MQNSRPCPRPRTEDKQGTHSYVRSMQWSIMEPRCVVSQWILLMNSFTEGLFWMPVPSKALRLWNIRLHNRMRWWFSIKELMVYEERYATHMSKGFTEHIINWLMRVYENEMLDTWRIETWDFSWIWKLGRKCHSQLQNLVLFESMVLERIRGKTVPAGEAQAKGRWGYWGMQKIAWLFLHKSRHQKVPVYCQISLFLEACFGGRLLQRDSQSHILPGSSCVCVLANRRHFANSRRISGLCSQRRQVAEVWRKEAVSIYIITFLRSQHPTFTGTLP